MVNYSELVDSCDAIKLFTAFCDEEKVKLNEIHKEAKTRLAHVSRLIKKDKPCKLHWIPSSIEDDCFDNHSERHEIQKFQIDWMKSYSAINIIGRRGIGETVLMNDLVKDMNVDIALGMSPSPDETDFFTEILPESVIHGGYNEGKITKALDCLKEVRSSEGRIVLSEKESLFLLSDCIHDPSMMESKFMQRLYSNRKSLRYTLINKMQYGIDLPNALKSNVDYVFVGRECYKKYRDILYTTYFNKIFDSEEDFTNVLDICTQNGSWLVLDRTLKDDASVEKSVFWYKPNQDVEPFVLCDENIWRLDALHRKSEPNPVPIILSSLNSYTSPPERRFTLSEVDKILKTRNEITSFLLKKEVEFNQKLEQNRMDMILEFVSNFVKLE